MKKIINGMRYDTTTATLIGTASSDLPRSDFGFWEAGLYRSPRSGRFFLAGSGGPMTRFARRVDGYSLIGGAGLFPISSDEALEWAETYLGPDQIEAHFEVTDA